MPKADNPWADLERLDRLLARTKPPEPERPPFEPTRTAFIHDVSPEERALLHDAAEHLTATLGEEPHVLATRREGRLLVDVWMEGEGELKNMRLETRLRSYHEGVLEPKHPLADVTFKVNGRELLTPLQRDRTYEEIEIDLTLEAFNGLHRER